MSIIIMTELKIGSMKPRKSLRYYTVFLIQFSLV